MCKDAQRTLHKKSRLKNHMCGMVSWYFFPVESELSISRICKRLSKSGPRQVRLENHREEKGSVNYHLVCPSTDGLLSMYYICMYF